MSTLDAILRPTSIAVIGASRQPNTIGWQILDNLLKYGFQGPVYPINPHAAAIHSIKAYRSVNDVPGLIDLGVIVVPKEHVEQVVTDCIQAGVKGLVIISAGFKEVGGSGVERERQLVELIRDKGLRLVGPNCMGVINTNPTVAMNATFAPSMPPSGPVAFMSQSGAMGLSVLDYAESLGIGISMFVSAGNKADVSGNDLLEYWREDPDTKVILLYLENFGNPSRFVELGRTISGTKPICVVKSGRTGAGARAAASHTGALAGTELATDALIAQAGAIRAQTVQELFDLAMAFSNQPLPASNRVAIVTNAGGPGIIIADASEANGLEVTPFAPETEQKLRARLPEEASVRNPVDLIASADADAYEFTLSCVYDDPNVDAAIAAFVPPLGIHTKDVAAALVRVNARHPEKPLLAVLMGREGLPAGQAELHDARVPAYIFPESAARALGCMWDYKKRTLRPSGRVVEYDTHDAAVETIIDQTLASGREKVSEVDALRVLQAYGVPTPEWAFVTGDSGASTLQVLASGTAQAAEQLGFPVALKVVSPEIVHKTDIGGVVLGLESPPDVASAAETMARAVQTVTSNIEGILVQRMAPAGTETIVGITRLPSVGPMVMFGLGGIYVEVLRDVVLRLAPLRDSDAAEMIEEVKLYKLLEGVRGAPRSDLAALQDIVLRVSQLAVRHQRIVEMDINPLIALPQNAVAVDARIQLTSES